MKILAIDPGPMESAFVVLDTVTQRIVEHGKIQNEKLLADLIEFIRTCDAMTIERMACMGMAVGEEVFETVFWSGRFAQRWASRTDKNWRRIKRHEVKMHCCGSTLAKDSNIRQAMIDRFGAPGRKAAPGPTHGLAADEWQALALAVTFCDKIRGEVYGLLLKSCNSSELS